MDKNRIERQWRKWNKAVSMPSDRYPLCEECGNPIAPVSGTKNRGYELLCDACYDDLMDERDEE